MRRAFVCGILAGTLGLTGTAAAHQGTGPQGYDHVGTFDIPANLRAGEPLGTPTSAEIMDVTPDGRTLLYTDAYTSRLGFVDIRDQSKPKPLGAVDLTADPTSVAIVGRHALVLAKTNDSFTNPTGELIVVDIPTQGIVRRIPLTGQPDSIALSPDRRWAAIVIENERNEDLNDGLIPQAPAGTVQVLELSRLFKADVGLRSVDLTGLAATAPDDPEPEFVDINARNEAVLSLQENNHLAIIDLKRAKVTKDFPAGSVTLKDVDATEDGDLQPVETITRRREPDAVHWIDEDTFATANEGDYEDADGVEGGSRGFTVFSRSGRVKYESGSSFEREVTLAGHYPESRSENKGVEPEGLEVTKEDGQTFLFVGAERANVVGVYEIVKGKPVFRHIVPAGVGPEGLKAIPSRNLLAVSSETDGADEGYLARPLITLYKLRNGEPEYPMLGGHVPWTALSGLSADPDSKGRAWMVSDSALDQAYLYELDIAHHPAHVERRIPVGAPNLDLEGVVARPEGGFWLASEGNASRPNALLRVAPDGLVLQTVELPASLTAGATTSGFEGVTVTGSAKKGDEVVWAVIQREWKDDAKGFVKIARYDVAAGTWTFARYPLDPKPAAADWVGLSEISLLPGPGKKVAIIERDNQLGPLAELKKLYKVDLGDPSVAWKPHGETLDTVKKTLLRDVKADLAARSITVPDKLEGVAATRDGKLWLGTDNDGTDENYGETLFFPIRP